MVDIINLSVQSENDNGVPAKVVVDAVADAIKAGVIVVVAAGNGGPSEGTMSRYATLPGVISVGASDWDGTRVASFSSRGWQTDPQSGPTIVAPGENVISSWVESHPKTAEQQEVDKQVITLDVLQKITGSDFTGKDIEVIRKSYTAMSGTSMACPYITAILAKFLELRKKMGLPHGPEQAKEFLRRVAKPIPGYGQHEQGYGFVSDALVEAYIQSVGPDDPFWLATGNP